MSDYLKDPRVIEAKAKMDAADLAHREAANAFSAIVNTVQKESPLSKRLTYAAYARCPCGAGLAYDLASDGKGTVFRGPSYWDRSAIILGTADQSVKHTDQLSFAFYEVKSENQPSANGATTRPK